MENKDYIFHPSKIKTEIDNSLECKLEQIDKQSEFGNEQGNHYFQIVENDQTKEPSDLAHIVTHNNIANVTNDNVNNYDFMNFRVIRYREDGTQITSNGDIDVSSVLLQVENGKDPQYILQNSNTLSDSFTTQNEHNNESLENTQYVQVIERDSIPLVYFTKNSSKEPKKNTINKPNETQYLQIVDGDSIPIVCYSENPQTESLLEKNHDKSLTSSEIDSIIPKDIIASPNFRLYLYPCKFCNFKCNAIKELTAHKKEHHTIRNKNRNLTKLPVNNIKKTIKSELRIFKHTTAYCPVCDFSTMSTYLLRKHVLDVHGIKSVDAGSKIK